MRFTLCLLVLTALTTGCKSTPPAPAAPAPTPINYSAELPPGTLALRKIPASEYPDFSPAFFKPNLGDVITSINQSLKYLEAPSSQKHYPYGEITHAQAVATLQTLRSLLMQRIARTPAMWNAVVAENFDVYKSIGAPKPSGDGYTGEILFTGYCTPVYKASLTRSGQFHWPLYQRPADLVSDDEGKKSWRRMPDGQMSPYPTRAQIEQGKLLDGQDLVFLQSRWDAYVINVQGSARLQLPDGRILEVGYAGNNGHDYVSPGLQMVADGVIPKSQLSLKGLRHYFEVNPQMMDRYLHLNPRFVFFTERPGGPFGSLNVPVTAMASIATDKSVYPRAMPAFVTTTIPASLAGGTTPYRAIMLDQDTGGAIRAAGRCDLYMGTGPTAEGLAGQQLFPGELYYLAVKPDRIQAPTP